MKITAADYPSQSICPYMGGKSSPTSAGITTEIEDGGSLHMRQTGGCSFFIDLCSEDCTDSGCIIEQFYPRSTAASVHLFISFQGLHQD